jgi:uncharacterized lipoprotein YddW (UPF0748 family)
VILLRFGVAARLGLLATGLLLGPASSSAASPRGLWVLCEGSQRVLESPEKVDWLLADARALGVTDLFVQVYRGGRAWFPSQHADAGPYARVFRKGDSDALDVLIRRAHAEGLRVHAWVNVFHLASNPTAPILRDLGRRAAAVDQHGRSILDYPGFEVPPPDRRYYRMGTPGVWLDPGAPGVRDRLVATFRELVGRYPGLDGVHLDYIRYPDVLPFTPGARFGVGLSFGYGEPSRARFLRETGLVAPVGESLGNANRWDDWRRAEVTRTVGAISTGVRELAPQMRMSAAVISDRERAYLVDFQDWAGWLDAGLIDFAVPMLYTTDDRRLGYSLDAYRGLAQSRELWVGLGSWLFRKEPERARAQLRMVEGTPLGSALFSWDALRETPGLLRALSRPDPPPSDVSAAGSDDLAPR